MKIKIEHRIKELSVELEFVKARSGELNREISKMNSRSLEIIGAIKELQTLAKLSEEIAAATPNEETKKDDKKA